MIIGIDHTQVTVPKNSENDARTFYCQFLGLKEIEKPDSLKSRGGFWLRAGDGMVHIGLEDGVDRRASKAHVAYRVRDLEKWRIRLEEMEIKVEDGIAIPGFKRFEFRDPFGNRIEMLEEN
jgi:catechol 2,3-dioxygenase-like lactoylglutathione lyase family enzyme